MQVANFTCRFGEKFVLLDMFDEVVMPAFTNLKRKRKYGDAEYFLIGASWLNLQMGNWRL